MLPLGEAAAHVKAPLRGARVEDYVVLYYITLHYVMLQGDSLQGSSVTYYIILYNLHNMCICMCTYIYIYIYDIVTILYLTYNLFM